MKLTLREFQDDAVQKLLTQTAKARIDVRDGEPQTLLLAAPTGSGKTGIATRWMELVIAGNGDQAPAADATFLWITDQPELNEQTRRKLLMNSSDLGPDDLITVDASFDGETFLGGKVYFLNTQKLGREKQLVTTGDRRQYTLWETVANTAEQHPESFWVVIDEAHRGMNEDRTARREARSIVQKFIKGSEGEIPPIPLIFGLSATPDRFLELVAATPRTNRPPVTVDPEDVRASGLLKEAITLFHPEEEQPSDLTLLDAAAKQIKRYDKEWADYSVAEEAPLVRPILVVQVEDASRKGPTKTDIAGVLSILEDPLGSLSDGQIAHAFQEETSLTFGERTIRYVRPADIQDDPDLRVVLFKRSLTTGWDCPRAEVMMSFRRAVDKTLIAQLVGRMVRTPLARRVSASDFLNSVCLYLPYYDAEALDDVIKYLTEPDPELGLAATNVQKGENLVTFERNPKLKAVFKATASLPTIRVEKISKQNNVRRLLRLGRLLAWDKLDTDAPRAFTAALVKVLVAEHKQVARKAEFKERVKDAGEITVRGVTVGYGETKAKKETTLTLRAVAANVDHSFAECGRKLGGGLHAAYLAAVADAKGAPPVSRIKLELYALLQDDKVIRRVEDDAGKLLAAADVKHRAAIRELPDERRQLYRRIRRQAARPESEDWELPPSIEVARNGAKPREKHLYADSGGKFACKLNGWEKKVLDVALAEKSAVAWLRNDPRKDWSFSIAYRKGSEDRPMYPDLLVFRRNGFIVCDIYEPHALAYADAVDKARGLAEFARDHGEKFGRIQLIAELKKGSFKRLRLEDIDVRDKVLGVNTGEHLRQLFEQA